MGINPQVSDIAAWPRARKKASPKAGLVWLAGLAGQLGAQPLDGVSA